MSNLRSLWLRLLVTSIPIVFIGCIDQFAVDLPANGEFIVINGLITNEAGPYMVSVSKSISLNSSNGVSNAQVSISDGIGQVLSFFERSPGVYESDSISAFQGRVGSVYQLNVITADGDEYKSEPEVMVRVPEIRGMSFVARSKVDVTQAGNEVARVGIEALLSTSIVGDGGTFLRWDYRGVFLLHRPNACVVCPQQCWVPDDQPRDNLLIFGSQVQEEGIPINDISITFLTPDFKLDSPYVVWVKQFSLNRSAYDFWQAVDNQRTGTGTIFDATPNVIYGNMVSISNPNEQVLGYFGASAVDQKMLNISRDELPQVIFDEVLFLECNSRDEVANYCTDCTLFPNSRTTFPNDIWQ